MGELLRKLAAQLREEHTQRETVKREKCANLLRASTGIALLQQKLKGVSNGH